MYSYLTNQYATHQPILEQAIKYSSGNILECGSGEGSTLFIKELIKNSDRKLITLESHPEYFNKYKSYEDDHHEIHFINTGNDNVDSTGEKWINYIENNIKTDFDVVFLDQSPWISRTYCLNYFKNKAKFIIIHDVDYYSMNNIFGTIINKYEYEDKVKYDIDFSDIVKNFYYHTPPLETFGCRTGPPTLLCSNILSSEEFNNIMNEIKTNLITYY